MIKTFSGFGAYVGGSQTNLPSINAVTRSQVLFFVGFLNKVKLLSVNKS